MKHIASARCIDILQNRTPVVSGSKLHRSELSPVVHVHCMCICPVAKLRLAVLRPPWTAALQVTLSMGFPRQEYWSGLPFPALGDLPHPGTKPSSPALAGGFFTTEPPGKPLLTPSLTPESIRFRFLQDSGGFQRWLWRERDYFLDANSFFNSDRKPSEAFP